MPWHNAPVLRKLTASQQGGNRGAQLWGVDIKGTLYTTYQTTPGGEWSNWLGPDWNGKNFPKMVYELASAQRHDGCVQLWVLDYKSELWTTWQTSPGGPWNGWQAKWNPPGTFKFKKISAAQLYPGGGKPARFWGISEDGILTSCSEIVPAGNWSPWSDWTKTTEDSRWQEVSVCKQGDNRGALWAIDNKLQLWCMFQKEKGGDDWGQWHGPNWNNAPKVRNIAAVEMGGQKGGCIWIISNDYKFYKSIQSAPGGQEWWPWSPGDYKESLLGYEITACGQNNGLQQVWGVSLKQELHSQCTLRDAQDWEWYWTPEVPPATS